MMENIDDLLNEDLSGSYATGLLFSNVYKVVKGGFDIDGVETYLGSAPVAYLANDIQVFEKLTEDKSWPVSSIIQRDVDDRRVKEIANDFILKSSNNVKYFPPIVIAIVPRENNEEISRVFELVDNTPQSAKEEILNRGGYSKKLIDRFQNAKNLSSLEGFYVLDFLDGIAQFPLCWDQSSIYAIVIDGQHRLEALKLAMQRKSDIGKYNQDIVFLDLSKKAAKEGRSPVEAIRRIFIDINYNAKPVTNARRTLMDDKDLSSLIVQNLVNDDDQNGERTGKYLLPQLVDWHSENLKHSFPQLTGVLVLQQLIEDNFLQGANVASISDLRESKKVSKFVNTLNSRFLVDSLIETKTKYQGIIPLEEAHKLYRDSIEKQTETDDKEDLLFSMDYNVLNVARDSFEEIYSKSVVKFFNELLPYKKAKDILNENSVFDPQDVRYRLIVKNPKKWTSKEKEKIDELSNLMHNSLDSSFYLCYTVLGQKAFFRHYYKELVRHLQSNELNEVSVLEFTNNWLSTMNILLKTLSKSNIFQNDQNFCVDQNILQDRAVSDYGLISKSFWQGIIYNDQSIIYNNQGIEGLLGVIDYMYKTFPIKKVDDEIIFPDDSVWQNINFSPKRIKSKIKQEYNDFESTKIDEIADSIWLAKLDAIKITIVQCLNEE